MAPARLHVYFISSTLTTEKLNGVYEESTMEQGLCNIRNVGGGGGQTREFFTPTISKNEITWTISWYSCMKSNYEYTARKT